MAKVRPPMKLSVKNLPGGGGGVGERGGGGEGGGKGMMKLQRWIRRGLLDGGGKAVEGEGGGKGMMKLQRWIRRGLLDGGGKAVEGEGGGKGKDGRNRVQISRGWLSWEVQSCRLAAAVVSLTSLTVW